MKKIFSLIVCCWLTQIVATAQLIDFDTLQTSTVTDADGNVYQTILFGDTWWMAENLRTKHFNDGTEIIQMTEVMDEKDNENNWSWWASAPRWGYPNFDSTNFDLYGLLYSWDALTETKHGGACPEGWSLTDTVDWFNLAKLIVGEEHVMYTEGIRNTPQGGKESYIETVAYENIGRFLKTDNGLLWELEPKIARDCNGANMNIYPSGKLHTSIEGFGEIADFWTGCYVHADSSGMGKRFMHFDYSSHTMTVSWNHNANLQSARCIKKASVSNPATGFRNKIQSAASALYPNPATGTIAVNLPAESGSWAIYNSLGNIVISGSSSHMNNLIIDIAWLPIGVYVFQFENYREIFIKH